jgi:hypothetical protein
LKLEHDVFHDVPWPGALLETSQKSTSLVVTAAMLNQAWDPGGEPFIETRNLVRREVLKVSDVDQGLKHRVVGPHTRTLQVRDGEDFNMFVGHRIGADGSRAPYTAGPDGSRSWQGYMLGASRRGCGASEEDRFGCA